MATPTDQQQIRATLRRHAKNASDYDAAWLALSSAVNVLGAPVVHKAIVALGATSLEPATLPPLMGTAEVADAFGIANSNISKLGQAFRPEPVCYISGGKVPVYLASDVHAKAEARRSAKGGGDGR